VLPDPVDIGVESLRESIRTRIELRLIIEEYEIEFREHHRYGFVLHRTEYDWRATLVQRGREIDLLQSNGAGPQRIGAEHEYDRVRPCNQCLNPLPPEGHRVFAPRKYKGNFTCKSDPCGFDGECRPLPECRNDRNPFFDQVCRQFPQPIVRPIRRAIIQRYILAFPKAGFLKATMEICNQWGVRSKPAEKADHRHRRLLHPRRKRPRNGSTTEQRNEVAPPHTRVSPEPGDYAVHVVVYGVLKQAFCGAL